MENAGAKAGNFGEAHGPLGSPDRSEIRRTSLWSLDLLQGIRPWASACLALYVAFRLELDHAYWAAATAAIVSQPSLGASLRKAWFRLAGTVIGALAIVVLTGCCPQSRAGFLLGLALWGAGCGLAAPLFRNFAAYGAALAGFTAVIIASDELGASGGPSGDVFSLAAMRVSEIGIGIVCAAVFAAGTDAGNARCRLAHRLAALAREIIDGMVGALAGTTGEATRTRRRDLIRQVIALDPMVDAALGEAPDLRSRSGELRSAVAGLLVGLSGWRTIAGHLERLPDDERRSDAEAVLHDGLRALPATPNDGDAAIDLHGLRRRYADAVRRLVAFPAETPSRQLLADRAAETLIGITRTWDGVLLLTDGSTRGRRVRAVRPPMPDLLPALTNTARAFVVILVVELFWIATAWPSGATAIAWATIFVITFSPTVDQAYATAKSRLLGLCLAAALAAIVKFAILPGTETFAGLALAIGLVLIPAGLLSGLPWGAPVFGAITSWFIPLLGPENQITYDPGQFYNSALAIVAGASVSTVAFRLLPPPSPALRAARLLAFTLRDLRALAAAAVLPKRSTWESAVFARLLVFPDQATPLQRARLLAAHSVGTEIIRLRHSARRLPLGAPVDAALAALAHGRSAEAGECLAALDAGLSASSCGAQRKAVLRAQGSIRALSEALVRYAPYFDLEAADELL